MQKEIRLILENQDSIMNALRYLLSNTPFPTSIMESELSGAVSETRKLLNPEAEEEPLAKERKIALEEGGAKDD